MIYLDTSVLLAQLLAEDRRPPPELWPETLCSSRLLEYEVWTRLNARNLATSHGQAARDLLGRVSFLELSPVVLERALEPFPQPLLTLDALHLASALYLASRGQSIALASYDLRLTAVAEQVGIDRAEL